MRVLFVILALACKHVHALEMTLVQKPADASSLWFTAIPGDTFSLVATAMSARPEEGRMHTLLLKDPQTGVWENHTSTINMDDILHAPPTTPTFYYIDKISGTECVGRYTDGTSQRMFRTTWDPATRTFSATPVYSSVVPFSNNYVISPNLEIIVWVDSGSSLVRTYYWTGTDYVAASTTFPAQDGLSAATILLTDTKIGLGYPLSFTGAPVNTRGMVELYNWQPVQHTWSVMEHRFHCPARPDADRRCYGFGTSSWITDTFAVIYAPDISDTAGSSDPNVGAYITYEKVGGVWNHDFTNFPDHRSDNARLGKVLAYTNDYALIEDKPSSWYFLFDTTGARTVVYPPRGFGSTSADNRGSTSYAYMSGNTLAYKGGADPTDLIFSNIEPTNLVRLTDMRVVASPTDVANTQFGRLVRVVGSYMAVCAAGEVLPGATARGAVRVYERVHSTDEWVLLATQGPGADVQEVSIQFCASSMDFDGETVAVGAHTEDVAGGSNNGAIYVYDFNGTALTLNTKIISTHSGDNQRYAQEVTVSGALLVTSAPNKFDTGGVVVVHKRTAGVWDAGTLLAPPAIVGASDYFGEAIHTDGTRIVACAPHYATFKGLAVIYAHNGTGWDVEQTIEGAPGDVRVCTAAQIAGTRLLLLDEFYRAKVYTYEGSVWTLLEYLTSQQKLITKTDSMSQRDAISMSGSIIVICYSNDFYAPGVRRGSASVFLWDGSTFVNSQEIYLRLQPELEGSYLGFYSCDTDGTSVVFSDHYYNTENANTVGRALTLDIFKPCAASADCAGAQVCSAEGYCVQPRACVQHADCVGALLPGRLPYCAPSTLLCEDVYAGTCTSEITCNEKHKRASTLRNKLGAITQTAALVNITQARHTVQRIYTEFLATTNVTQQVGTYIDGTETASLPATLFANYGDTPTLLAHIRDIVCPAAIRELCTVDLPTRRVLQDSGLITVQVTYSISSEVFDTLAANGTSFSDGGAFESALAAALNVTTEEITLTAQAGTLVVEYVVAQEATGLDPVANDAIAALQEVEQDLSILTAQVTQELGLAAMDIQSSSIDYCAGRDCNGRGTCDPLTGICECTDTNYWGVNCETPVDCAGGTKSPTSAYCICTYPAYGLRCTQTVSCGVC